MLKCQEKEMCDMPITYLCCVCGNQIGAEIENGDDEKISYKNRPCVFCADIVD